jgi:hypothetical protein
LGPANLTAPPGNRHRKSGATTRQHCLERAFATHPYDSAC